MIPPRMLQHQPLNLLQELLTQLVVHLPYNSQTTQTSHHCNLSQSLHPPGTKHRHHLIHVGISQILKILCPGLTSNALG